MDQSELTVILQRLESAAGRAAKVRPLEQELEGLRERLSRRERAIEQNVADLRRCEEKIAEWKAHCAHLVEKYVASNKRAFARAIEPAPVVYDPPF